MRNESGTIAAISTAMSNSGIGIVRMSGEEAVEIAERIYKGKNEKKLSKQPTHTIHYGYIVDGEDTIDEVLVMLMRGPHSYTGEDTVEINCHGGVYVVRKNFGDGDKIWRKTCRSRRIYKARIFKWKDGSVPGRGGRRSHFFKK